MRDKRLAVIGSDIDLVSVIIGGSMEGKGERGGDARGKNKTKHFPDLGISIGGNADLYKCGKHPILIYIVDGFICLR